MTKLALGLAWILSLGGASVFAQTPGAQIFPTITAQKVRESPKP
jgi:hypothetical protein